MSIESVCKKEVATIEPTATLSRAAEIMNQKHVGSLVVVQSHNGHQIPAGIITDRDLALTLGSSSPKPQDLLVQQIMRSQPLVARAGDEIFETVTKMREHGVKRLPVIDQSGSLIGIVCADDLTSLIWIFTVNGGM
jgi:CBS domain-containing protein